MESSRESTASGGGRVGRRRLLGRLAIGVILAGVSAVLFKAKVGWFFPVVSGSMAPTVETGEWVFLRYDVDPLERFDIVAFTGVGGGASIKRVIGLPGARAPQAARSALRAHRALKRSSPSPRSVPACSPFSWAASRMSCMTLPWRSPTWWASMKVRRPQHPQSPRLPPPIRLLPRSLGDGRPGTVPRI